MKQRRVFLFLLLFLAMLLTFFWQCWLRHRLPSPRQQAQERPSWKQKVCRVFCLICCCCLLYFLSRIVLYMIAHAHTHTHIIIKENEECKQNLKTPPATVAFSCIFLDKVSLVSGLFTLLSFVCLADSREGDVFAGRSTRPKKKWSCLFLCAFLFWCSLWMLADSSQNTR